MWQIQSTGSTNTLDICLQWRTTLKKSSWTVKLLASGFQITSNSAEEASAKALWSDKQTSCHWCLNDLMSSQTSSLLTKWLASLAQQLRRRTTFSRRSWLTWCGTKRVLNASDKSMRKSWQTRFLKIHLLEKHQKRLSLAQLSRSTVPLSMTSWIVW